MQASVRELPSGSIELRVHPEGGYGAAWPWGCVVSPKPGDPRTAWVTLAARAPTRHEARAVNDALVSLGYERVQWERIDESGPHHTRVFQLRDL